MATAFTGQWLAAIEATKDTGKESSMNQNPKPFPAALHRPRELKTPKRKADSDMLRAVIERGELDMATRERLVDIACRLGQGSFLSLSVNQRAMVEREYDRLKEQERSDADGPPLRREPAVPVINVEIKCGTLPKYPPGMGANTPRFRR